MSPAPKIGHWICHVFPLRAVMPVVVVLTWLVSLLLLLGCSPLFNDRTASRQTIFVSDVNEQCMGEMNDKIQSWIEDGKPTVGEVVHCLVDAVDRFTTLHRGETDGAWSAQELSTFLGTYFTKDGKFFGTEVGLWAVELMRLKVMTIGGASDRVTIDEIHRLRSTLIKAQPLLEKLSPQIAVAFMRAGVERADEAEEAASIVESLATFLADELAVKAGDRPPTQVEAILQTVRRLGYHEGELERWLALAKSVKSISVGGYEETIAGDEWPRVVRAGGKVWGMWIRFHYRVELASDPLGDDGLPKLESLIFDLLDFANDAVHAQGMNSAGITVSQLTHLIDALEMRNLVPFGLTAQTIKDLVPVFLQKFLHGVSKGNLEQKAKALQQSHVEVLREAAVDWLEGQRAILKALAGEKAISATKLAESLRNEQSESASQTGRAPIIQRAYAQLIDLFARGRPLVFDEQDRLIIRRAADMPDFDRHALDLLNGARAGISVIFRGYAEDRSVSEATLGLTESELQAVYQDIKNFGREIGWMDIRNDGAGARTFLEASIFTSVSNGDARVDIHEIVEWFATAYGSGALADSFHKSLVNECALQDHRIDVLGKEKLNVNCFREKFAQGFTSTLANLPVMTKWLSDPATRQARLNELLAILEIAGRPKGRTDRPIDSSEIRGLIPILHYLESLFARHDVDHNDLLNKDELFGALPILQSFIRRMGNGAAETPERQEAIFSYLLRNGRPPDLFVLTDPSTWGSIGGLFDIFTYQWRKQWLNEIADRPTILKVIASFAVSAKQSRARDIAKYYQLNEGNLRAILQSNQTEQVKQIAVLFQCLPSARETLGEVLKTHVAQLLPPEEEAQKARFFQAKVQSLIESQSNLEIYCLPF